jgi:hypothetical protein
MQNRAQGPSTPTDSAASNTQGPESRTLHAARLYQEALGRIRVILSGYRLCEGGGGQESMGAVDCRRSDRPDTDARTSRFEGL